MDVQIRPERADELDRVDEIVRAAFGDEATPRLLTALRESDAWRDLSFVAVHQNLVVGHLALTRGWIDAPDRLVEVLVMSPVSVHPDWQGRGIGTRMLVGSLEQLANRSEPAVFLEGKSRGLSASRIQAGGRCGLHRTIRTHSPARVPVLSAPEIRPLARRSLGLSRRLLEARRRRSSLECFYELRALR